MLKVTSNALLQTKQCLAVYLHYSAVCMYITVQFVHCRNLGVEGLDHHGLMEYSGST